MKPLHLSLICISILLLIVYVGRPSTVSEQKSTLRAHGQIELPRQRFRPEQEAMIKAFSDGPPRMVCFAPGTDPAFQQAMDQASQVAQTKSFLAERVSGNYTYNSQRWTSSATNGTSVGTDGVGLTLTWSIIPDGTTIVGSAAYNDHDPSDLRARLDAIYVGGEAEWLPLFQEVFDGWEAVSGIKYVYVAYDDGADMGYLPGALRKPGVLGTRADIRIGGHNIDGNANVLAYNYFPSVGDMVIDTNDTYYSAGSLAQNKIVLKNVLYHEHGHGLGLGHVCPVNNTKIMEPYLNTGFLGPQHDDIRGIQAGYGDVNGSNNRYQDATPMSVTYGNTTFINGLSIDQLGEADYFRMDITQTGVLRIAAAPSGLAYLSGPQDVACAGSSINSKAMHNLGLTVYTSNGTSVLRDNNTWPIGETENISYLTISSTGTYYLKVYSSAGSEVQLYDLEVSLGDEVYAMGVPTSDLDMTFADVSISGATVQAYNAVTQLYENIVDDIDSKRGYWVKLLPFTPDFGARPVAVGEVQFPLKLGWNLLSVPSDLCFHWDSSSGDIMVENLSETVSLDEAAKTKLWVEDYAWIFNQSSGEYAPIYNNGVLSVGGDEIAGGQSFWFYSKVASAILKIDVPAAAVCEIAP